MGVCNVPTNNKTFSFKGMQSELAELLAGKNGEHFNAEATAFLEKLDAAMTESSRVIPPRSDSDDEYRMLCNNFAEGSISATNTSGVDGLRAAQWLLELGFGCDGVVHNVDHTLIVFSTLNESMALRKPTIRVTYSNVEFGFYVQYGIDKESFKCNYIYSKTLNKDFWDYVVNNYTVDNPEYKSIYAEYKRLAKLLPSSSYLSILETIFN